MNFGPLGVSALAIFSASSTLAATIQLSGLRSPQDTALVSNISLSGNVYTFTIENTAGVGVIPNFGESFGNSLRLVSFNSSTPFQYNIQNNLVAADFNFPLDFAMVGTDQTQGLMPGQSATLSWTLSTASGMALSGISAADIAQHQVIRFRLLPTASGTDLAVGPAIPEPGTFSLVFLSVIGLTAGARNWARFRG
jgi:hypothetical protein